MSEEPKKELFANWLTKELSKRPGMTPGQLAQQAHISRAAAYKYFNDERVPDKVVAAKIAVALGVDPSTLPEFPKKKQPKG